METVNSISNQKLTEIENEVYNLCVANAETYGEDGGFCYDETDYESLGITLGQMKGYLGQLVKKGYITACEGCYFTHFIVANDCV
jgi:hypothetical protein